MLRSDIEYRAAFERLVREKNRIRRINDELKAGGSPDEEVARVVGPMRSAMSELESDVAQYEEMKRASVDTADAERIVAEIYAAFQGVTRGRRTLHEALVVDNYGTEQEEAEARKLDRENCWEEIPDKHIENGGNALCHLDPESWRYYIARFMIWTLRHFARSDSFTVDQTIYGFAPGPGSDLVEYAMNRYRLLDAEQARAVCRFLRFMTNYGDFADARVAREALASYWGKLDTIS